MRTSLETTLRLVALLALPGLLAACQPKEADLSGEDGIPFELFAPAADTRTTIDGMQTQWLAGDRLSVFHAPAGSAAYVADGPFTVDDPSSGHATGTVYNLVTDGASDWYLAYPYKASNVSPKQLTLTLGSSVKEEQLQQGYDNTAHLAGEAFPLFGKGREVTAGGVVPSVSMHLLPAAVGVRITNESKGIIALQSVSFTAPVPVIGQFKVDVSGDAPVFTPVNADAVSQTATLAINDDTLLAIGETATLYLGICPFTAAAGESLSLEVHAINIANEEQVFGRTVTLEKAVSFSAGHIKYLNLGFTGPEDPFLSLSAPGVYQLDGQDHAYVPGRDQLSIRTLILSNTVSFRILSPSTRKALEVSDFPLSPAEGDTAALTLSFYEGNNKTSSRTLTATIVRISGTMAWCKTEDGVGIILYFK